MYVFYLLIVKDVIPQVLVNCSMKVKGLHEGMAKAMPMTGYYSLDKDKAADCLTHLSVYEVITRLDLTADKDM